MLTPEIKTQYTDLSMNLHFSYQSKASHQLKPSTAGMLSPENYTITDARCLTTETRQFNYILLFFFGWVGGVGWGGVYTLQHFIFI